jgi:flagellar M-ring protein FliF
VADNLAEENPATTPLTQMLARFGARQNMALIVAVAALIALLAGIWLWGQNPEYRVLYSNLSDRDGGDIIASLQQMNVPYKFAEGGGALLIPADQVHEVRLRLASQGLPKGGTVGFELMENQKFGISQFLEQVNYQHALEGELARSVQTLAAVQSARVHLAIPKPTVFVKERQNPSASVVLTLYPGRALDPGQVNGIIHLISSSVPEMPPSNVAVLDQSGLLLSPLKEGVEGLDASQLKYVRQIEQDYVRRVEEILKPLVGDGNVHAQVTADIDFSQTEQTAETYKPNQNPGEAALRSQQTLESQNGTQNPAGVPGALTNQPPVPATAPIVTPASAVAATNVADTSSRKEATLNYEVDRTIRHTKLPVGSIRRLSAAVVINYRTVTAKSGKTSTLPLSDDEKAQMTALIKDTLGFDASRGDTLNVLNSAFTAEKEAAAIELPLWKQPEMIALGKDGAKYLLFAIVLLYLLFGVIRPALKKPEIEEAPPTEAIEEEAEEEEELAMQQEVATYESNLQALKQLSQQDPKIVASVVKEWVSGDE